MQEKEDSEAGSPPLTAPGPCLQERPEEGAHHTIFGGDCLPRVVGKRLNMGSPPAQPSV